MSTGLPIVGPPIRGRSCGSCTACCTQVPVQLPDEHKPANVRCRHLRAKGCGIYARRPRPCWAWSCRWLFDEMAGELRRPDRSGYTLDPALDTVLLKGGPVDVLQIWVDPARPDAHRAPELRAYLEELGRVHGLPALVRWNSSEAVMLMPGSMSGDGRPFQIGGGICSQDHLDRGLAAAGATRALAVGGWQRAIGD